VGYSVATTSTKAPSVIKEDIKRVLDRMQVQYREIRGGFDCIHLPSIDINSVQPGHHQQMSSGSTEPPHHRTSIVKKASKLSFGVKRDKGKDRDKDKERERENSSDKDKERPSTAGNPLAVSQSDSSSFFNVSSHTAAVAAAAVAAADGGGTGTVRIETNGVVTTPPPPSVTIDEAASSSSSASPTKPKVLPPIPRDFSGGLHPINPPTSPQPSGEVDREAFESMRNNTLSVRFEINIVKVSYLFY
jgi:hypothetical protein